MKKKNPKDPFGLSLLDVLSNALAGTIILMLIVAVSVGGNDKSKKSKIYSKNQGSRMTLSPSNNSTSIETNFDELTIQIFSDLQIKEECTLSLKDKGINGIIKEGFTKGSIGNSYMWELYVPSGAELLSRLTLEIYCNQNMSKNVIEYFVYEGSRFITSGDETLIGKRDILQVELP